MLFGFFIAYENYFVDGQKEYLIDREFRNLGRLSGQLAAEFDRARLSVSSLAKIMRSAKETPHRPAPELDCGNKENISECFEAYSKTYLGEIWDGHSPSPRLLVCLGENPDSVHLKWDEKSTQLKMLVECPPSEKSAPNAANRAPEPVPILRMDMKPWVHSAFEEYKNSFEDVLVADESGRVLFQQSDAGPRIANLRPILRSGADISTKQNVFGFLSGGAQEPVRTRQIDSKAPEEAESVGARPSSGPTSPKSERLSFGSSATRVAIAGKNYLLFAQPCPVTLGSGSEAENRWNLVLVGLRLAAGVDAESHALPYTVLIWLALCGVVLLGFSWPWFKLQYMSNTERFRPRDGWFLLFNLLLISAGVMVMLLNGSYLLRSTELTDDVLKKLAQQMKKNFNAEITRALRQLEDIQDTEEFRNVRKDDKDPGLVGSYPIERYPQQSYPYFEIAFWGDRKGNQLAKLDIRKVATPSVGLEKFEFYRFVKSEMEWAELGDGKTQGAHAIVSGGPDLSKQAFFQPIMSPNTNEFAPVLAAPFKPRSPPRVPNAAKRTDQIAVQVLVFRPISVIDPVFPPGYGFAIIDSECKVLFHSDSFRNMKENFCEESKNSSELRPWLVSGVNSSLDISYGGKKKRAYLTNFPLPGFSVDRADYLLVFQEADQQLTLDLAVILVCSILMASYFALLGMAAAGHLILRGPLHWVYAPRIVWPCREFAMEYLQVFFLCMLLGLLYRSFYHGLHEAPLLGLTLGVALLSLLFAVLRLSFFPGVLFRFGMVSSVAALLSLLAIGWIRLWSRTSISGSASKSLTEWTKLPLLLLAFGLFAALVSAELKPFLGGWLNLESRFVGNLRNRISDHFNPLYSLATMSLIVCVSMVPCTGFFKYAFDAVSELSLKHDEAVFSEHLLARRNRIADYYKPLRAHQIAEARLAEPLDRYDKIGDDTGWQSKESFFHTCHEPGIDGQPENPPCPLDSKNGRVDFGLNDWIEKHIAQETLMFPSNELGSEISRLGVAETDKSKSWERFWLEPQANIFRLQWKEDSRAPRLVVWSEYAEWQGLKKWARGTLLVFLITLVVWLISLAKRIFLTNVECAPAIEIVRWRTIRDIKRDSLVIGLPRSGKSAQLRKLEGLDPRDLRDLRDLRSSPYGASKACELESTDCHSGVIIVDQFDFNMRAPSWNQKRLALIEKLLNKTDQKLVLVSTVDPLYFLAEERRAVLGDEQDARETELLLERWARALDKFSRVKLESTVEDEFAEAADRLLEQGKQFAQFARWICQECAYTPMLQKIGVELLEKFQKPPLPTREQLLETVVGRADAYYRRLWAGLTTGERLVLYQLALDGWANSNPKNTPAIHQLEQKKLIYRQPMYRIMNDTFRRFIQSSEHEKEIAVWQKQEQQSTWQILRFMIIAAIIGTGAWLLYAQAQLFQIGTGYITAIATLLTAIAGLTARAKRPKEGENASVTR